MKMIKDSIHMEIEMEQQMSSRTKRSGEEYYELKFQLRFKHFNDIDKQKKKFFDIVTKQFTGINKFEDVEDGFDFFFRDLNQLNRVSRFFQKYYLCEEKRSKKIVGRNFLESKDIWRHTLFISILNFSRGDRVLIKGEEYYIKAFNKKEMVLRHVKDGSKKVVTYSLVKDYFELIEKAPVSSRS